MAFEERLTATIRGVEFLLESANGESGRNAVPHSYPKKEIGWTEDNGKALQSEKIEGRVLGDDYLLQLQNVLEALNAPGPAEMIHPWFGVRQVQVGKVSHKLVIKTDKTATFSFEVFEVGENLFPGVMQDTANQCGIDAENAQNITNNTFANWWDIENIEQLGDMVDLFLDDLDEFTRGLPSLPNQLQEWTGRLYRVKYSVGKLLAYPGELANETMGLLGDVKNLVSDPVRSLEVYDQVLNRWDGSRAELAATGGLIRNVESEDGVASSVPTQADPVKQDAVVNNANIYEQLIINSSVISKADALASSEFENEFEAQEQVIESLSGAERPIILTAEQFKNIGNNIADKLAELAEQAVERGDSAMWRALRTLRTSVLLDTRNRAEQLPLQFSYTPFTTMPVAYVAWSQLGDTERRQSIVRRNGLKYPSFITPNQTLELIKEE